jgi:hypothetical protein
VVSFQRKGKRRIHYKKWRMKQTIVLLPLKREPKGTATPFSALTHKDAAYSSSETLGRAFSLKAGDNSARFFVGSGREEWPLNVDPEMAAAGYKDDE